MGLEQKTVARKGRKKYEGKLYVDSKAVTFRSKEFRWEAPLDSQTKATATRQLLHVESVSDKLSFEVGSTAAKWADKINNPPSRLTKLGIKPEHVFWISKGFTRDFNAELKSTGAKATRQLSKCAIAFWKVTHRSELDELEDIADELEPHVNLWIVWTKGSEAITQSDVMNAARALGFGPSKTAAFDDDHSSMRFARKKKK